MKKLKKFFVRWFNWFICKEITKEPPKEHTKLDKMITKENINSVQEKPKRKRVKKKNNLLDDKVKEQKKNVNTVSKDRKKTVETTRKTKTVGKEKKETITENT